jgi:TRAP-type C4-dicarboxylate transport system substrate-binding protein
MKNALVLAAGVLLAALSGAAAQAELSKVNFHVIGSTSRNVPYLQGDVPFWTNTLPESSGGAITGDITPFDQMGIDDKTLLRLLSRGVMDIVTMGISKMAGDNPVFEGCDLAGLALDGANARAACTAWKPAMDEVLGEQWNARILSVAPQVPQVFWCRVPITGLADLKGKKIRVSNRTQIDFVEGISGIPVNIPFADLIPSMQRGVVDCAVTGSLSGNTAGLAEVSSNIFPMYLGWSIDVRAINLTTWNRLTPEDQAFLQQQFSVLEDRLWQIGEESITEGDNCNTGKDPCTLGKKANLTMVPVRADEADIHKNLMETAVLRNWAERCGAACAEEWNNTVGPIFGLAAPVPGK